MTAAVALAVAVPVIVAIGAPASWWTLGRSAKLFQAIPVEELAACDADPSGWRFTTTTGVRAWALDPQTFAPLHSEMPTTSVRLSVRLSAGEAEPVLYGPEHGTLVIRRAGACSLVVVRWPLDGTVFRWFFLLLVGVLVPSTLLASWIGGGFVLRPMLASMRELDRASRGVGTADYRSPQVESELEAVRTALDEAHSRVQSERAQLEEAQRWLETHIADVAHDLRTPLTSLTLHLERAGRGEVEAARAAVADVTYLSMLTDNLALSGQLRSGLRSHDETVDLGSLADRVVGRFGVLAGHLGHQVLAAVPDAPVPVQGTALYLEQILSNLVHNALHHHDGNGTVVVVVEPGEHVVVEVCDDGPGVVSSLPTERSEAASHGLGLSIVRSLVSHLGGMLTIEANEPRGLIFRITL